MSRHTPVTLADIAAAAQVSISTVSRIMHQRDGSIKISHATQERVLAIAQRLGYEANPFAAALRTQRTGVLGVIIRDISDPFLSLMMRILQRVCHAEDFEVLIGHAEYDFATAQRQLRVMLTHWFDGLFLLGNVPGDEELLQMLDQHQTPYVAIAGGAHIAAPLVTVDDEQGTNLALTYLYDLGHRRIAFLGDVVHAGVRDRLAYFERFVRDHALVMDTEYTQLCGSTRSSAATHMDNLLALATPPTAVFCASDMLALGAFTSVWQKGWQVPDDLSIIGFDDIEESAELFPALTTIHQPVERIAQTALAILRSLTQRPPDLTNAPARQQIIPAELVVRQSCATPRAT